MIQLPIQPSALSTDSSVADARPRSAVGDTANIVGFRAQAAEPNLQERAVTVQSFLAQFDTARQDEQTAPASQPLPAMLAEAPVDDADAGDAKAPVQSEDSPSGAEAWLAGMLGQAGLTVQARDNPPEQTSARVSGFATQIADVRAQLPGTVAQPSSVQSLPTDSPSDDVAPATTPAPREATQSQAQTLLQQHLATASTTQDSPAGQLPAVASLDPRLPVTDSSTPAAGTAPSALVLDKPLHLKGGDAHWGEQMLGALRDNVELQLNQRVQNATIRLDPPELGSLEILVRHEAGQLNVQISAANGDVVRMLQQTSERLRQELVGQNFLQVNVQVSADAQSGQPGQQNRQRFAEEQLAVASNPRDAQAGERTVPRLDSDVLITV